MSDEEPMNRDLTVILGFFIGILCALVAGAILIGHFPFLHKLVLFVAGIIVSLGASFLIMELYYRYAKLGMSIAGKASVMVLFILFPFTCLVVLPILLQIDIVSSIVGFFSYLMLVEIPLAFSVMSKRN